jgi:hypothetical protein
MLFLGSNGYRVIAHDRRSHGRSDQTWTGNDMDTYADNLATLLEMLDIKGATSAGPMAPHLPTRGAARPPKPRRPAHHTRHAHREDRGNGSHAVSRRDPFCNSLAKIQ